MRLQVIAVGRLRPPFEDDVAHYAKLLSKHARLELVELRESEGIGRRIDERTFVCALDAEPGAKPWAPSSEALARFVEERRDSGRDLAFVVGGPWGLPELERVDRRLSLGAMTLPHQLARVVLLEQLFRAHKILLGEPYHH
jgi:23S rRNA (pseudouridine1915-N3)-methyltransferase